MPEQAEKVQAVDEQGRPICPACEISMRRRFEKEGIMAQPIAGYWVCPMCHGRKFRDLSWKERMFG
jgi:predicted nucleic acid-binding Zn ribbon protein